MTNPAPTRATLNDWIAAEAIPFSTEQPETLHTAIDKMVASLGDSVDLLGFGEALHGGEDILILRNLLFQRLVETHGYSAIAIESSFPRGYIVNEYISGRCPSSYDDIQDTGVTHGFGRLEANRELIEWMRTYNADPSHTTKLQFYGFDTPTESMSSDSPRQLLQFVLDYLTSIDMAMGEKYQSRIEPLFGEDSAWETTAAAMDPTQSIGLSADAMALRIEVEELIGELQLRRPELVAGSGQERYLEAVQYAALAQWLLTYHAAVARQADDRYIRLLGLRDAMMADNLAYIANRERKHGRVLAFAHNSHLRRGQAHWQLGPDIHKWWPAGAHLDVILGSRYAVIGSAIGVSDANGIGQPESGTLESLLTNAPGPVRLIPTHKKQGLPGSEIVALPIRSGSTKNHSYFPLTPESLTDFDWLAVLDSTDYNRGGLSLGLQG